MKHLSATLFCAALVVAPVPSAAQRIKLPVKLPELERLAAESPYDAASQYNVGLGYWSAKNYDGAEKAFEQAITLDARFAAAHLALAYLPYARRPDLWKEIGTQDVPAEWLPAVQEMGRRYRTAFVVDPFVDLRIVGAVEPPKDVRWVTDPYLSAFYEMVFQGFDDFRSGDYPSAYRRFNKLADDWAVAGKKNIANLPGELLWYRGLAASLIDKPDEAARDVGELLRRSQSAEADSLLKLIPLRTNEYRYLLGSIHARSEKLVQAAELFDAVVAEDIGMYMAWVQLANVYERLGLMDKALAARRSAVDANPEDHTSMVELAETQVRAGRAADAKQTLDAVIATDPHNIRALYIAGIIAAATGDTAAGRAHFEQFLKDVPPRYANEIADVRKRIAALQQSE